MEKPAQEARTREKKGLPTMPRQSQPPKRKKTIHGGGTIYLRNDGRYVASIKDPNSGKRIDRYAKTEKEAEKKLEDVQKPDIEEVTCWNQYGVIKNYDLLPMARAVVGTTSKQ
jgi:hypothetical protein